MPHCGEYDRTSTSLSDRVVGFPEDGNTKQSSGRSSVKRKMISRSLSGGRAKSKSEAEVRNIAVETQKIKNESKQ